MIYMLDTNICIYLIKKKPPNVLYRFIEVNPSMMCISSVTYAELIHGVEKSQAVEKNRLALSMFLSQISILDFDSKAAEAYGEIRASLEKKGTPIGTLDMMIAGHAMSLGYTIVTNNTRKFLRIDNLKIENWTE